MDLDRWIVQPVPLEVDGVPFRVAEITLEAQARLQAWLRQHVPHPVAAVKDHLKGLSPEDRATVLETASREARYWPPKIGTAEAARAMLTDARGQAAVFLEGLRAADPTATPAQAEWLAKRLNRTRNTKLSRHVLAIIFGTDVDVVDEGDEGEPDGPKADGAADASASPSPYTST